MISSYKDSEWVIELVKLDDSFANLERKMVGELDRFLQESVFFED